MFYVLILVSQNGQFCETDYRTVKVLIYSLPKKR